MKATVQKKRAKAIVKAMEKKIERAEALKPMDMEFRETKKVEHLLEEIKVPPLKAIKDKK